MALTLDIAVELYPLSEGEAFTLAVARSLVPEELEALNASGVDGDGGSENGEGVKKIKRELWRSDNQGLAADYEYVMYGKVSSRLLSSRTVSRERTLNACHTCRSTNSTTRHKGTTKRAYTSCQSPICELMNDLTILDRTAYFSFGGLLMALRGSYRHLASVVVGENVYLLLRK